MVKVTNKILLNVQSKNYLFSIYMTGKNEIHYNTYNMEITLISLTNNYIPFTVAASPNFVTYIYMKHYNQT